MLINDGLVLERDHPAGIGGKQRLYRWGNYGLSLVNSPMSHSYAFAWEAAVLKFKSSNSDNFELVYDTPLTNDVEVFASDEDANKFIQEAKEEFTKRRIYQTKGD